MLKRVWIPSPNYSSRQGSGVRMLVLHSADGARTIESLGEFFSSSASQVSSHAGADDTFNTIGEFVKRENKAWTQAVFNPVALSLEICGFSNWSADEWHRHPNMLENTARWLAEEAEYHGIPLDRLSPSEARGFGIGICAHSDLGSQGGGHTDPGPGFPMNYVLALANGASQEKSEEKSLVTSALSHDGTLHLFELKDETVWYTFQYPGKVAWNGAESGVGIAKMTKFADAKDVVSISAIASYDGTLHLFGRKTDGSMVFTYQRPHSNSWTGGRPGVSPAGLHGFSPAPGN